MLCMNDGHTVHRHIVNRHSYCECMLDIVYYCAWKMDTLCMHARHIIMYVVMTHITPHSRLVVSSFMHNMPNSHVHTNCLTSKVCPSSIHEIFTVFGQQ